MCYSLTMFTYKGAKYLWSNICLFNLIHAKLITINIFYRVLWVRAKSIFSENKCLYYIIHYIIYYVLTCNLSHHICLIASCLSGTSLYCITSSNSDSICTLTIAWRNNNNNNNNTLSTCVMVLSIL